MVSSFIVAISNIRVARSICKSFIKLVHHGPPLRVDCLAPLEMYSLFCEVATGVV